MAVDPAATPRSLRLVGSTDAKRPPRGRGGAADPPRMELQRARKLVTAAEAVRRSPFAGLTGVGDVSPEAVAEHLQGVEACQLAAFEQALALAADRATAAFQARDGWLDRVRAALLAVLEFFDEQPALARFLLVHSTQAGGAVLAARSKLLDRLARALDDERAPARSYPPPLTAQAVVNGALGVLHERLSQPASGALAELTAPLMSFIALPFLGPKAAHRELHRPVEATSAVASAVSLSLLHDPGGGLDHHRTVLVLRSLAAEPDLSNRELALRTGVESEPVMSRTLTKAARVGLVRNTRAATSSGLTNAWRLTASGEEFLAAITREASEAASMAVDVPAQFGGRMDHRAVEVLRVIVDQPWLYTREVGLRAGVDDPALLSKLLSYLSGLGVVASAKEPHRKGTPKAWMPTASGEELDRAIGRETSPAQRSLALDLMWQCGGRLSDDGVAALRVIGAEPGLSNVEIAVQVGITDQNIMSALLALLARRALSENTRKGGRYNAWQLTGAGKELERAIRQETPASVAHRTALDLFRRRGGRLNHRVVSVLRVIGAEPDISNDEIALRAGIKARGTTSTLLARFAAFGLIRNTRTGGRFNSWRLTATGRDSGCRDRWRGSFLDAQRGFRADAGLGRSPERA